MTTVLKENELKLPNICGDTQGGLQALGGPSRSLYMVLEAL